MAPPVGILGPVPAVSGLGFAWKQTGLGSGDLTQYQLRSPVYAVRINVDWRMSWTFNLSPGQLLPPFNQLYWPLTPAPQQPALSITASYNWNLLGQDQLPIGERIFDLPPKLAPSLFQTWVSSYNVALNSVTQNPFTQTYWPLTPAPLQINRTIAASYNPNLIGQDQLPIGKDITDLTPRPYPEPRTWVWSYNLNLIGQDKLNPGKQVYDLTPIAPPQILPRSWTWSYNLNLIGQDQLPVGKIVTELPKAPQQPIPILTASYNKNLIGQDQLPTGAKVTDIPPQPPLSAIQLRTWIQSVNLALITAAAQQPFNQFYWPINPGPLQPIQTFTGSYNRNLIGQDKLPIGKAVYDLPPRLAQPPTPILVASYNPNLIGQDKLPNRQQDWPNPRGYEYPIQLRSSIFFPQIVPPPAFAGPFNQHDWPLPIAAGNIDRTITARSQFLTSPTPPPPAVNIERPYVRDWWDSDEWGNIYPGSGIRRG